MVPFRGVNKKHRAIFDKINEKPDRKDIDWNDFIALLDYLGAQINLKRGSAAGIRLNGIYAVFHKPHPDRRIYPTDLKRIRRFLKEAGIENVE